MKQYTQPADGIKKDACEGNSGQYSFFLNGLKNSISITEIINQVLKLRLRSS